MTFANPLRKKGGRPTAALAAFGTPASIDPVRLFALPVQMQAEGLRLLIEMGQSQAQIVARTGLSWRQIEKLIERQTAPYRRDGEEDGPAEGEVGGSFHTHKRMRGGGAPDTSSLTGFSEPKVKPKQRLNMRPAHSCNKAPK